MKTPPTWYIEEIEALTPLAERFYTDAKPLLDRYAQLWIELNDGAWSRMDDDPSTIDPQAIDAFGMERLAALLLTVGERMDELELAEAGLTEAARREAGVDPL